MALNTRKDVEDFVRAETEKSVKRAMDSEMRDEKRKLNLYERISRHTGSFNHEEMSLEEMAAHAAKKLSIELAKGDDAVAAIEGYLKGRAHAAAGSSGMDSAPSFLDSYLKDGAA